MTNSYHLPRSFILILLTLLVEQTNATGCLNRKHVYVCDNPGVGTISCPSRAKLSITYANYGRTEIDAIRCPFGQSHKNNDKCFNAGTQALVQSMCNDKNVCTFNTSQDAYAATDPCPGTYKYLDVEYDCINPDNNCAEYCDADYTLSSTDTVVVTSPNYPSIYPNYLSCKWNFTATQQNALIKLEFLDLSIESRCEDYVYLFDTYNGNNTKVCLEYVNKLSPFLSSGNKMSAWFYTDGFVGFTGFKIRVTAVTKPTCAVTQVPLTQDGTSITSPFYPNNYPALYDCQWHFTSPPLFYIFIKFFDVDLENDCNNDYIMIVDNNNGTNIKYCGNSSLPSHSLVYQTTSLSLYFKTNYLISGRGYNITIHTAIDFNECTYDGDNICDNDINQLASCKDQIGSYSCVCPYTDRGMYWDGIKCTTGKSPDTLCQHQNGLCEHNCTSYSLKGPAVSPVLNFTCSCFEGYQLAADGRSCTDINECDLSTTCNSTALPKPVCVNSIGSYTCSCTDGYLWNTYNSSCVDVDECQIDNGGCDHMCTNTDGTVQCTCDKGFTLLRNRRSCQDTDECSVNNGGCQQVCSNIQGSYKCSCLPGYALNTTNNHTCENINECSTSNGRCQQICEDSTGGYRCRCHNGYRLAVDERTCADIDECKGNHSCQQICINQPGSYTCGCNLGYTLDSSNNSTCKEINECSRGLSGCAHICNNTDGSFQCGCNTGYKLLPDKKNCADENECLNTHGCEFQCVNFQGGYKCICNSGYELNVSNNKTCDDVNECNTFNGYCQEVCNNTIGGHFCTCPIGYVLRPDGRTCKDIDECSGSHPCQHECVNIMGSYKCVCKVGFMLAGDGFSCTDVNECLVLNGGCAHSCNNIAGGFTCGCRQGYRLNIDGRTCLDNDECNSTNKCAQLCINVPGQYRCTCDFGYNLNSDSATCKDINECTDKSSGCAHSCANTLGSFNCSCNHGYTLLPDNKNCGDVDECASNLDGCHHTCDNSYGSYKCSCMKGFELQSNSRACADINECNTANGYCQQLCNNSNGGYNCYCLNGFSLNIDQRTCNDVDECSASSLNSCNQSCVNTIGSYKCECNSGFLLQSNGHTCNDIDECASSTSGCAHNCTNTPGSYICACLSGYVLLPDLKNCLDRNECAAPSGNLCQHTCVNANGGYKCACYKGYKLDTNLYSCVDDDECSRTNPPCEQNCTNTAGSFTCQCRNGFTLLKDGRSCQDIDECILNNNNPCSYVCINDLGSFHCICPLNQYLHPDGYRCMGSYYYTVLLSLDLKYDSDMANPRTNLFTSIDNSIKANIMSFIDNSVKVGLETVFVMTLDNIRGDVLATVRLQFTKALENKNLSIIIYQLQTAIMNKGNILQINGNPTRVIATMQYEHKFTDGTTIQWDVLSICHLYDNINICTANSKCLELNGEPFCSCDTGYEKDNTNQICVQKSSAFSTTYIIIIGTLTGIVLIIIIVITAYLCFSRTKFFSEKEETMNFVRSNKHNSSSHSYSNSGEFEMRRNDRPGHYEIPTRYERNSFRMMKPRDQNYQYNGWHRRYGY